MPIGPILIVVNELESKILIHKDYCVGHVPIILFKSFWTYAELNNFFQDSIVRFLQFWKFLRYHMWLIVL